MKKSLIVVSHGCLSALKYGKIKKSAAGEMTLENINSCYNHYITLRQSSHVDRRSLFLFDIVVDTLATPNDFPLPDALVR